jgi:hypothetical protein
MKEKYVCPVCGNEDSRYIGYSNGSPYCRLCLPFSGKKADRDFKVKENIKLELSYPLSEKQEIVAKKVKELLINKSLIFLIFLVYTKIRLLVERLGKNWALIYLCKINDMKKWRS